MGLLIRMLGKMQACMHMHVSGRWPDGRRGHHKHACGGHTEMLHALDCFLFFHKGPCPNFITRVTKL
jgi:hypothetical protein